MPGAGQRLAHARDAAALEQVEPELAETPDEIEEVEALDGIPGQERGRAPRREPPSAGKPRIGDEQDLGNHLPRRLELAGDLARHGAAGAEAA